MLIVDVPHRLAEDAGSVEHAGRVPNGRRVGPVGTQAFDLENFPDRLRDRQVARRKQHHVTVARALVNDHLPKGADLVEASVGARIRRKHEPRFDFESDAIGHDPGGIAHTGLTMTDTATRHPHDCVCLAAAARRRAGLRRSVAPGIDVRGYSCVSEILEYVGSDDISASPVAGGSRQWHPRHIW